MTRERIWIVTNDEGLPLAAFTSVTLARAYYAKLPYMGRVRCVPLNPSPEDDE